MNEGMGFKTSVIVFCTLILMILAFAAFKHINSDNECEPLSRLNCSYEGCMFENIESDINNQSLSDCLFENKIELIEQ